MSAIDHARLRWRCRRGVLELDILLQQFLVRGYDGLSEAERRGFERLLTFADVELLPLLQGQARSDDPVVDNLVAIIRRHTHART